MWRVDVRAGIMAMDPLDTGKQHQQRRRVTLNNDFHFHRPLLQLFYVLLVSYSSTRVTAQEYCKLSCFARKNRDQSPNYIPSSILLDRPALIVQW